MKRSIAALLLAGLTALLPAGAAASCAGLPPAELVKLAPVILVGRVTEVEQPLTGGTYYHVTPERVLKGKVANPLRIYTESGRGMATSVDYKMQAGETHTLYLSSGRKPGTYATNACSGSHPGEPTPEETRLLGEGQPAPPPGDAPAPAGPEPSPLRYWIPYLATGLGVGAVLFVLVAPRLLRRRR